MTDTTELEGTWSGAEEGGAEGDWVLTFTGNRFEATGGPAVPNFRGAFTLDPIAEPRQIDMVIEGTLSRIFGGEPASGIYQIEGEALTLAMNEPGAELRPASFERVPGTRVFVGKRRGPSGEEEVSLRVPERPSDEGSVSGAGEASPPPASGVPVGGAPAAESGADAAEPGARPPSTGGDAEQVRSEVVALDPLLRLVRQALDHHRVGGEQREPLDRMMEGIVQQKMLMVSLFALLGETITDEVRKELVAQAPGLSEQLRYAGPWFGFEDIKGLTDREVQTLLREVDQKDLVVALIGASDGLKEKVLSNMSRRVRTFITEEMEFQGEMREHDVLEVQARIVLLLLQLAAQGQVSVYRDLPIGNESRHDSS